MTAMRGAHLVLLRASARVGHIVGQARARVITIEPNTERYHALLVAEGLLRPVPGHLRLQHAGSERDDPGSDSGFAV